MNKSLERQNTLQEQLTDGRLLHRASDDPVRSTRDLRFQTNLSMNEQFAQNLDDAQSWMSTTDSTMSDISSVMIKINELVISADDSKDQDALNTIGQQVDELVNQMVQLGNTKVGDRYIFGGQNDSTAPFVRTTIQDPQSGKTKDVVVYNGDTSKISMPLQLGAVNALQDSVNLTGADVFGPITNTYGRQTVSVFDHLLDIKNELKTTATVQQTNSSGGIGTVTGSYTGIGYEDFDVRIDTVGAGGVVTAAQYSKDGGKTWTAATITTAGSTTNPTTLQLSDGISFNITASASNTAHSTGSTGDVYSFRVPQSAASIMQSNASGGAAAVTGTYTGKGATAYSVKVTSVDAAGQVTGAEYSIDKGETWTSVSPSVGNPSAISLSNGVVLNITADTDIAEGDTYSFQVPQNTKSDVTWLSKVATQYVQDDHNMQLKQQTELGTRMSMYEMAANMMDTQNSTIQSDIANNGDIDIAKTITDFNTAQTLYRSALAVGARVMPASLVDFLS